MIGRIKSCSGREQTCPFKLRVRLILVRLYALLPGIPFSHGRIFVQLPSDEYAVNCFFKVRTGLATDEVRAHSSVFEPSTDDCFEKHKVIRSPLVETADSMSQACEALDGVGNGGPRKRIFVSKRSTFFGNRFAYLISTSRRALLGGHSLSARPCDHGGAVAGV